MDGNFEPLSVLRQDDFGGYRRIIFDTSLYPMPVVLKTLYWFTDRYYIQLSWENESRRQLSITFRSKNSSEDVSEEVVGEFCNALIDQSVRYLVQKETQTVRDIIVKRAFSEALPRSEMDVAKRMGL
ncbi:MAG: His-Xaa-Ser system protein HxsD [Sutterella sp.]|nr:His-Xaa-Ser system protein HxsD [Sutterella sp.]